MLPYRLGIKKRQLVSRPWVEWVVTSMLMMRIECGGHHDECENYAQDGHVDYTDVVR